METKIYKMELMVLDQDKRFVQDLVTGIENCKYIYPSVMNVEERTIEFHDGHPLNKTLTSKETFKELFSDSPSHAHAEYVKALDLEIDFS